MTSIVLAAATLAAGTETSLAIPAPLVPAIAAAVFLTMGIITFSYRDVANRHGGKSGGASSHQDESH